MRTVVIDSQGTFQLRRRPEPVAGPGAVVVRVRAAGLDTADLRQARGDYPAPRGWPADVPGLEVAGEVEQAGPGLVEVAPGDPVMALVGGGHAERIAGQDGHRRRPGTRHQLRVPAPLVLPGQGRPGRGRPRRADQRRTRGGQAAAQGEPRTAADDRDPEKATAFFVKENDR
nr:alcohol dehydrogenase catalytic domain-containing protein [Streptomyces sp. MMG1121]